MTEACKKNWCGASLALLTLFGLMATLMGTTFSTQDHRLNKLEDGRDEVVAALSTIKGLESNLIYIRDRLDTLVLHGVKPINK